MEAESIPAGPRLTLAEYLAAERTATHKSDFYNGEVFAMAGGSSPHSRIASNLTIAIGRRLDGRSYSTHTSDMLIQVRATEFCAYPDVSVVCGEEELAEDKHDCLLNPGLIAEVLSPSTQEYDREKFFHYQQLPSLRHYLLIHQDRAWIEHFARVEGSKDWSYKHVGHPQNSAEGLVDTLHLPSLEMEIPLGEIYRRVVLMPFLPSAKP